MATKNKPQPNEEEKIDQPDPQPTPDEGAGVENLPLAEQVLVSPTHDLKITPEHKLRIVEKYDGVRTFTVNIAKLHLGGARLVKFGDRVELTHDEYLSNQKFVK